MHRFFLVLFLLVSSLVYGQTDNYDKAVELFREAGRLQAEYDFENAQKKFSQAGDLFKQADYQGNYIQCKISESLALIAQNKYRQAEDVLEIAQSDATKTFGSENRYMVLLYFAKGQQEFGSGNMQEALEYFQKSEQLSKKFPVNDPFFSAKLSASYGNIFSNLGDYKKAHAYYLQDLKLRLEAAGTNAPELSAAYNNLSITARSLGNFKQALAYLDKGLEQAAKSGQSQSPNAALLYSGKGSTYYTMGQYNTALQFMEKALEIKKSYWGDNHRSVADEYNNIGLVYKSLKNYSKAITAFRSAYEIQKRVLGNSHPEVAITSSNFASVLFADEKYESALTFYHEAAKIIRENYGNNHPQLANIFHNMGNVYKRKKEYEKALEFYCKAKNIYSSSDNYILPALVLTYVNLGETYHSLNKNDSSLMYYQKALQVNVPEFSPDSADYFSNPKAEQYADLNYLLYALSGKARVLTAVFLMNDEYDYAHSAYETYLLADSLISSNRKTIRGESDKLRSGNRNRDIYESAVLVAANMGDLQNEEDEKKAYYEKAFYFSEKNKAALLSDAVYASEAKHFSGIPDSLIRQERFLDNQISGIKTKLLRTNDARMEKQLQNELFELNRRAIHLSDYIEQNYPNYYQSAHAQEGIKLSVIQQYLQDNQALRSYFFSGSQLIIFTVTADDIKITSADIPYDFEEQIISLRKYLTSGLKSDFPKYLALGRELYDLLFPGDIPQTIEQLVIVPDHVLGIIPFEALITENFTGELLRFSDYPFLIKNYTINYFYSASLFAQAQENSYPLGRINSWLGLAPVFSNLNSQKVQGFNLSELPGTQKEIDSIYSKVSDTLGLYDKLTGEELTKQYFQNLNLSDYDIIHIATHGLVNTQHPELSGLIFYPSENETENIVFAGEIYNFKMNSDLVVLSACETGLGKISKSEGIIGLTRSFIYAGAKNIVVSLWMVEDESTAMLMQYFYDSILSGNSYTDALHSAKLKLIRKKGKYAHPFFWSPFVLIGN
jgi:CHAT domain-containing protein